MSSSTTDRNLLFAVLALQADLLTRAQFVEACSAWAGRKDTSLGEWLVERGWMQQEDRVSVERLLKRKLGQHGGDARAGLAETANPEVLNSLAGLDDADVQRSLAGLSAGDGVVAATTAYETPDLDRYTLAHLHARGGIGRVWLARDGELGREVALKELLPENASKPAVLKRFLEEARITGQLEHPSIVPVYELVRHPDNQRPYYTMRFVRGRTLAAACRDFHEQRGAGAAGTLELRGLLNAFVSVCQAVAYAHARGVIHRDLKGANVVLGDFGEVMVLDWGLAKITSAAEVLDEAPAPGPPRAQLTVDDTPRTHHGQVLGTPGYMAPEQADGRLDELGPHTDVYGLGAMLYEILTGRPPFRGADTQEVLDKVRYNAPTRPRKAWRRVPRALEAVCLKALAKKPLGRYGSAAALADEVQRWLADEPVTAWREPLPARVGRWARRHRVLVAAAAVLLVAAVGFLGSLAYLVDQERKETEKARAEADANFRTAEEQRQFTDEALYFNRIAFADRERSVNNFRRVEELLALCPPARRHWEWHYLHKTCHAEVASWVGHGGQPISHLARSPDGRFIASGSGHPFQAHEPGSIIIWDAQTRKPVQTLRPKFGAIMSLQFHPDGEVLVATGVAFDLLKAIGGAARLADLAQAEVSLWHWKTGKTLARFPGWSAGAFSPDGKLLAAGDMQNRVLLLSWKDAKQKPRTLPALPGVAINLTFTPNGEKLVASWQDMDLTSLRKGQIDLGKAMKAGVHVWDVASGTEYLKLADQGQAALNVAGTKIATSAIDGNVRVWDLAEKKELRRLLAPEHIVNHSTFSADDKLLATVGIDRLTRIWNLDTGREAVVLPGHGDIVTDALFEDDGKRLVTSSWDGTIKVWNTTHSLEWRVLRGGKTFANRLAVGPNQRLLVSAGLGGLMIWDLAKTQNIRTVPEAITALALSADGRLLAAATSANQLRVWDVSRVTEEQHPMPVLWTSAEPKQPTIALAFSPDSRLLALGSGNPQAGLLPGKVVLREAVSGRTVRTLHTSAAPLALAFGPQGRTIAIGCADQNFALWDTTSGEKKVTIADEGPLPNNVLAYISVAFAADGSRVAFASANALQATAQQRSIGIWDVRAGKLLCECRGHAAPVAGLALSPDGLRLASATLDINRLGGEVKVWETTLGSEMLSLPGHQAVSFSPDGRLLAAVAGAPGAFGVSMIRVWEGQMPEPGKKAAAQE